jgi:cytochrome c oxidase subunit III
MEIGVIKPISGSEPRPKGRSSVSLGGTSPSRGGGGDDGGDGGNDRPNDDPFEDRQEIAETVPDKAKVVTWFLLLVVLMTFGGLIGAYVVIATNREVEWKPFDLPLPVWISTALIIISSFVYHAGKKAIDRDEHEKARNYLVGTTVFGAAFIASQILAWMALVRAGLYMQGNPYAGFFYILTGIHAIHVLGGIVALGAILLRVWTPTAYGPELEYRRNLARSVGWYWHFMGALWLVLFALLGFWK